MKYQELVAQWEMQAHPTKNQTKRVRSSLCRLADASLTDDWRGMTVVSRDEAIGLIEAYVQPPKYTASSRHTYLSNLRFLYDWAEKQGVIDPNGHCSDDHWLAPNGQPWVADLSRRQRNAYDAWRRYALAHRVSKQKVRAEDLLRWLEHQRVDRHDQHYRKRFQLLRDAWPVLVEHAGVPGIPLPTLPPKRNGKYALKQGEWPAAIQKEWDAICRKATSRWDHMGKRKWRATTVERYTNLICRILGWSKQAGRLQEMDSLSPALSPSAIRGYLDWLVERSGRESLNLGHGSVIRAAKSITALYLDPEEAVTEEFKRMQREDFVAVIDKALLIFPYRELEQGVASAFERVEKGEKQRKAGRISVDELAARHVDAIILTLLVTRGLRSANIRMIRLDKHVIGRDGRLYLRFDQTEMKNHMTFETTVPEVLRPMWQRFVESIRPKAATLGTGSHLLLARTGEPLSAGTFAERVRSIGRRCIGREVQPHLYRHLLACHIARDLRLDPATLQRMLGHRSLNTTFKYYAPVSPAEAAAMLDRSFGKRDGQDGNRV